MHFLSCAGGEWKFVESIKISVYMTVFIIIQWYYTLLVLILLLSLSQWLHEYMPQSGHQYWISAIFAHFEHNLRSCTIYGIMQCLELLKHLGQVPLLIEWQYEHTQNEQSSHCQILLLMPEHITHLVAFFSFLLLRLCSF